MRFDYKTYKWDVLLYAVSQISNVKVSFEALSSPGNSSTETTTGAAAAQNLNSEFVSIYELTKV